MPRKPFLQPHTESVHILIELLNESNNLDDWLVLSVDISGALRARVGMGKTQLSFLDIFLSNFFEEFGKMSPDASEKFINLLGDSASNSGSLKKILTHAGVTDAQLELLRGGRLGFG